MDKLSTELRDIAKEENIKLVANEIDDVLIYALFQQVGIHFLKNRGNPDAFEPAPGTEPAEAPPAPVAAAAPAASEKDGRELPRQRQRYPVRCRGGAPGMPISAR